MAHDRPSPAPFPPAGEPPSSARASRSIPPATVSGTTGHRRTDPPPGPPPSGDPGHDLAGALHEVSNALTVVVGWLERALGTSLDPGQRRALQLAHARALDGRDIARGAIGARAPSSVQQSLASLLDEALVGVQPEALSRGVHLSLQPLVGSLLVDDARVALQILTNLLLNAVAFSPAGGTVLVVAAVEAGEAVVRVVDEGPGPPPERRARLFERGASTRAGGAGIGLAHAHALALTHGGSLAFDDEAAGSTFVLRWPGGPARSSAETRPRPSLTLRGRRVLLIEDDASVIDLLDIALSSRGVEVVAVTEPTALRAALSAGPFDLILLDWSPIAADAHVHLASLRHACPGVPLVAISGSAALSLDDEALAACAAWVRKPFDLTELLDALTAALLASR